MKITCLVVLTTLVISFLFGCVSDPATYYFDADELMKKATKIELVECVNDSPTVIDVNDNTVLEFNKSNARVVKELEKEKIPEFLTDLSTVTFHIENESVNSPVGYAVLIYTENEVIVISCTVLDKAYGMVAVFTSDGDFVRHIAQFADEPKYRGMVEKYFGL